MPPEERTMSDHRNSRARKRRLDPAAGDLPVNPRPDSPPPQPDPLDDHFSRKTPEEQRNFLIRNRLAVATNLRELLRYDDFRLDACEPCKEFVTPLLAPPLQRWADGLADRRVDEYRKENLGSQEAPWKRERNAVACRLRGQGLSWRGVVRTLFADHPEWFPNETGPLSNQDEDRIGKALALALRREDEERFWQELRGER
jgi:hypothetical protein